MNAHPCVPLLIGAAGKLHRLEPHHADLPDLIARHPQCLPIEGAEALAPGSRWRLQSPDGALVVAFGDLAAAVAKLDAWKDREPRPTALVLICDRAADLPSGPLPAAVAATITVITLDVFATPAGETLVCPHVLARLQGFLDRLAARGIRPVYDDRALTLAWETDGRTVPLAHISPLGVVWTAPEAARREVERLALELGLTVHCVAYGRIWSVSDRATLADALDVWADALEKRVATA